MNIRRRGVCVFTGAFLQNVFEVNHKEWPMSIDHLQGHFEWVTAYISNICIWFKIEILIDKIVQSVPDQDNDSRFPGVTVVADHSYHTVPWELY